MRARTIAKQCAWGIANFARFCLFSADFEANPVADHYGIHKSIFINVRVEIKHFLQQSAFAHIMRYARR